MDLDGTLLTSDKTVTARAQRAIAGLTAQGVRVVICTGRPPRTARVFAELLKLELAIVYNGAAVYDFAAGRALHRVDLPGETARATVMRLRRCHPGVMCGLESSYGWFVDTARYELVRRGPAPYETEPSGVGDVLEFIRGGVTKLLFWHPVLDSPTLSRSLDGLPVHGTWSMPGLLEVVAEGVSKRSALERVARSFGMGAEAVAAFGDQHNDKEMLAWAGLGVAMGNADAHVRALADLVTASNDEDGVARVLEAWL